MKKMCLARVTKQTKKAEKLAKVREAGGGRFNFYGDELSTPCYYMRIRVGRWVKADNKETIYPGGRSYRAGFHKYATKAGANQPYYGNFACRVELRGVHTEGEQDGETVLVADEMIVHRKDLVEALRAAGIPVPEKYLTRAERHVSL